MLLHELDFMDLYVRLDANVAPGAPLARYKPESREKGYGNHAVPAEYMSQVLLLINEFNRNFTGIEGSFVFGSMRFRAAVNTMENGETWAVLRRINDKVRTLKDLGIADHIVQTLRPLGRRDGLVLMSGATGAGKTTTMYGMLYEYLQRFGGTAITIEDPVEYRIENPVGEKGYGYQVQVKNDDDWAHEIKRSLRWTPRYILVGEVRTPQAAEQVLRAATTGHLVFTSLHAGSVEESLYGLLQLAEQRMGPGGARHVLAAGITACIHQSLSPTGPYIRYIFSEEHNNGDPLRALIRDNKIGQINSYIDRQAARTVNAARGTF